MYNDEEEEKKKRKEKKRKGKERKEEKVRSIGQRKLVQSKMIPDDDSQHGSQLK